MPGICSSEVKRCWKNRHEQHRSECASNEWRGNECRGNTVSEFAGNEWRGDTMGRRALDNRNGPMDTHKDRGDTRNGRGKIESGTNHKRSQNNSSTKTT